MAMQKRKVQKRFHFKARFLAMLSTGGRPVVHFSGLDGDTNNLLVTKV